MSAHFYIAT